MHAVLVRICMAQGTVTVLDGAGISERKAAAAMATLS